MTPQPTPPEAVAKYIAIQPQNGVAKIEVPADTSFSILFTGAIPTMRTDMQYLIEGNVVTFNEQPIQSLVTFDTNEPFVCREPYTSGYKPVDWTLLEGASVILSHKVTLPVANSTVQVWKPSDGAIAAFIWEAGLPIVRESCYLLADSENYLEGMSGEVSIPSTVQSVLIESQEDYELVLWFAQMKIKLTNGTIIDAKPFNGSGGGVVEKLPQ